MARSAGRSLVRRLPILYGFLAPLTFVAVYLLAHDPLFEELRLGIYLIYAVSASVIAAGCVVLVRRSEDGKASVWLVAVTYEAMFFAFTLAGILVLVVLRTLYPQLLLGGSSPEFAEVAEKLSYALVACGATGTTISACVLLYGFLKGGLEERIYPWPRGNWRNRGDT